MILLVQLCILSVILFVGGLLYAIHIKLHPAERTWVSVVIGNSMVATIEAVMIGSVLFFYGLLWLWWLIPINFFLLAVAGLPMIFFQEQKLQEQGRQRHRILSQIWDRDQDEWTL